MNILLKKIPVNVRSAVVYTISSVLSRGLAIITVPIFTRLMTTSEIGVVNMYTSWNSILTVIVTLSLTSGGFAVAMKEYENERDKYQSSVLFLTSIMAIIVSFFYFIRPEFWNSLTGLSTELSILMLIGFLFSPAYQFWLMRQRYEYNYIKVGLISISSAIISAALSVFVVYKMIDSGMQNISTGRLYASNVVTLLVAAFIWLLIFFRGKTLYDKRYWKLSLSLSLPLIGYAIATQILNVSDRLMIGQMVGNDAVGIYGTLYTVSSISLLVWSAINSSFVPYLYQNIEEKKSSISKLSLYLMGLYAMVAVTVTFLAPEIVGFLATEEYYQAIYIMPPIAAGIFLTSVSNMYTNIIVYHKKTKYVMYGAIIAAVSNVVANFIFIPRFGYISAAYTTLFSFIILSVFEAYFSRKVNTKIFGKDHLVYDDRKVFIMAVGTIVLSLSGLYFYNHLYLRYSMVVAGFLTIAIMGFKTLKMRKNKFKDI